MSLEEAIIPVFEGSNEDFFTRYIEEYGYYDLFLIGRNGDVFYTAVKEADYKTNMVNGKFAASIMELAKGANDMSKNAGEAATGAADISANIQGISRAIADNGSGIRQVDSSAKSLAQAAGDLKGMAAKFKISEEERSYEKAA